MAKTLGAPLYTYNAEEVIEFRDNDHTPYNKRSGEVDSHLTVQMRAPLNEDWVNFLVEEKTTTKSKDHVKGPYTTRTASRAISFNMSREQFAAVVAHVNRTKD